MKRKIKTAICLNALNAPGLISGETSLTPEKQPGIDMEVGVDPGFLTISYKNETILVPLTNVRNMLVLKNK